MNEHDSWKSLTRLSTSRQYVERGTNPTADRLFEQIVTHTAATATPPAPTQRPARWRRWLPAIVITPIVLGGTAVATNRWLTKPTTVTELACYSEVAAEPQKMVVPRFDPSQPPEQQCAPAWTDGTLGSGTVPPLASCVSDTGISIVIPGTSEQCGDIGLAERVAPGADGDQARRVVEQIELLWPERCVTSLDEATRIAERIVRSANADDWSIEPPERTRADECFILSVDETTQTLYLTSIPFAD